ncbi:MAG TPA: hypothetical protein VFC44_08610 [Candidatus Saccharimonadales bacterium]|nr:hypothetical protein [Candidatus Saccharimonadales bacterium]
MSSSFLQALGYSESMVAIPNYCLFAMGDPLIIGFDLLLMGVVLGTSVLTLILVLCGCRFSVLRWCGWALIVISIFGFYACYFPIGHFSTPDPSSIFEPIIPLGAGIITVYLLRRPRDRAEHNQSAAPKTAPPAEEGRKAVSRV